MDDNYPKNVDQRGGPDSTWYGYSVGHWDGDYTLVIDTTGSDDSEWLDQRYLFIRRALFFTDPNVQNAIDLVDAEIKSVQGELTKIARSKRKESEK